MRNLAYMAGYLLFFGAADEMQAQADCHAVEYQGHVYRCVQIDNQCWFAENLRAKSYANGDAIPGNLSHFDWLKTKSGAQAIYDQDADHLETFGCLYNWFAVADPRGLCPNGWHVPSDEEWMALEMFLGMGESDAESTGWRGTDEGTQMKSSTSDTPSWDGTNSTGFSGLPGGFRDRFGYFLKQGEGGYFWSAAANGPPQVWFRQLISSSNYIHRLIYNTNTGFSVRCIRDE